MGVCDLALRLMSSIIRYLLAVGRDGKMLEFDVRVLVLLTVAVAHHFRNSITNWCRSRFGPLTEFKLA